MEITFKRNLNQTTMIISGPENRDPGDDSLQMILRNQVPGLLTVETEQINGELRLVYDISSRAALQDSMERGSFSREHLQNLVRSIGSCMDALKAYLLDPKNLMLRLDCIFTDAKKSRYGFCYHPFYPREQQRDLQELFERILACIDYEDQELVTMAYEMYMAVQRENLQWKELEELAEQGESSQEVVIQDFFKEWSPRPPEPKIEEEPAPSKSSLQVPFPGPAEEAAAPDSFWKKCRRYLAGKRLLDVVHDLDDGVILQKIHATDNQAADVSDRPYRKDPGQPEYPYTDARQLTAIPKLVSNDASGTEVIELTRLPFHIGKLQGDSDYILNSATVSRHHACIYRAVDGGDHFLIEDQQSRNGTYVNGVRIRPYVRTAIREGDRIRLADREFVFTV